jgi:hypothetical protein
MAVLGGMRPERGRVECDCIPSPYEREPSDTLTARALCFGLERIVRQIESDSSEERVLGEASRVDADREGVLRPLEGLIDTCQLALCSV